MELAHTILIANVIEWRDLEAFLRNRYVGALRFVETWPSTADLHLSNCKKYNPVAVFAETRDNANIIVLAHLAGYKHYERLGDTLLEVIPALSAV